MWKRPVGALRRRAGRLALAQLEQVAHGRPDDRVVERRGARQVGDAQVDPSDVQAVGGRALRLRERGLLGRRGVLADDVLGDACAGRSRGGRRARRAAARAGGPPAPPTSASISGSTASPPMSARSSAIVWATRAVSAARSSGSAHSAASRPARRPDAGPSGSMQRAQREQHVGQRLARDRALARHLVAAQRPGQLAAARRAPGDERAEGAQLVLLVGGDDDRLLAARGRGRRARRAATATRRCASRPAARSRHSPRRRGAAPSAAGAGARGRGRPGRVAGGRLPAHDDEQVGRRAPGAHRASAGASSGNASPCTSVSPSPSATSGEAISSPSSGAMTTVSVRPS